MVKLLGHSHFSGKELDLTTRRYFEVIYCDEIDNFIYQFGFSKSFIRRLKLEGEPHFNEVLRRKSAVFLLNYHFGGGFWILPFLKDKGIKVQFHSTDIKKEDYPSKRAFYFFHKFSNWVIGRMFGRRVAYKQEGRKNLINALREGVWVTSAFDVPPYLIRDNVEVQFLNMRTKFPKGLISIAKELKIPVLPFFSYLENGTDRKICFEKPIYVKNEEESVKECVRLIDGRIRERPDHWHLWPFAYQFLLP